MKIFEYNAIKQLGIYVLSLFIIALLIFFYNNGDSKTQNQHKSTAKISKSNDKTFAKYKVGENEERTIVMQINQKQSSENFTERNETFVLGVERNSKDFLWPSQRKNRDKRFILFENGGVVKLVLGITYPIILADPLRSLLSFYNLHLQYAPPPNPLYSWSLYNTSTFPASTRQKRQTNKNYSISQDVSREIIYEAIKAIFERAGLPGEDCLLQMICEISANPFHIGPNGNIFHELLNAIFIPTLENVKAKNLYAFRNGHYGGACDYACSNKINWLKRNTILF